MALAQERGAGLLTPPEDAPTLTPYAGKRRLDYIDTLRGLAAIWVLFLHYAGAQRQIVTTGNPVTAFTLSVIGYGQLGVNLFLVVSGFCLFYPLARRAITEGKGKMTVAFWPFMARRARRILPPYWALLTLQVVSLSLYTYGGGPDWVRLAWFTKTETRIDWTDLAAHFFLVHNLFARYIGSMAVPFWSIALEWQLYVVFPSLIALHNRCGIWRVLMIAFLISAGWQLSFYLYNPHFRVESDDAWRYAARNLWSLPSRLFEFVAGMAAAWVVAQNRSDATRVAVVLICVLVPLGVWTFPYSDRGFVPLTNPLWGIIFASLIVALNALTLTRPNALRLLRPITAVGFFSYSLYLLHVPLMSAFGPYLYQQRDRSMSQHLLWIVVVALPINLAYAYFWHYLFERPVLNASKGRKEN